MTKKKVSVKRNQENSTMSKKKKSVLIIVSVLLLIAITLSVVLPVALKKPKDVPFQIPALALPIEEQYALQKFKLDELGNTVTTIRADTMNVTERGIKRQETKETDHTYVLTSDDGLKSASFEFLSYPGQTHSVSNNAEFAKLYKDRAEEMFPEDPDAITKYFYYYKYMLMSQTYNLTRVAQEMSLKTVTGEISKQEYQDWLTKFPAADDQYGEVVGTDNAVRKEITLDPIYRSYHATGLYLPAGEVIEVKVEGLDESKGEQIQMLINAQNTLSWRGQVKNANSITMPENVNNKDNFFYQADNLTAYDHFKDDENFFYKDGVLQYSYFTITKWQGFDSRLPWIWATFTFNKNGTYYLGTPTGGIMHINPSNCYSNVKTTITGAVETPHYILGVTTPEYFDEYLREAPGVVGVMDTENGQLIGPTGAVGETTKGLRQIKTDEVQKLAMLWHSFFAVNESFTGGSYNRKNWVMFDRFVPAGAAVALGNFNYACPTGWFNNAMNYRGLLTSGQWGILHEVGHNHGSSYGTVWGFGCSQEGEVRNNALTLLCYIMFCDVGTTVRMGTTPEHGEYANPYRTLTETLNKKGKYEDANSCGYFEILGMYSNIMHSFGAEKYYELLYTYKANPSFVTIDTSGLSETERNRQNALAKRADFAYRCSTVYGMDFRKYFNDFYSAKITDDMFTSEQLSYMKKLPNYEPVSCFYAGGIDGVKTSGDYLVAYGKDITFDLYNNTISSLDKDGKKGFEILSGASATHGKIKELEAGKIVYSFNPKYFGTSDEIKFKVKLNDGIIHEFTIFLRINYNSTKLSTYTEIEPVSGRYWEYIDEQISTKTPIVTTNPYSYIPSYTTASGWEIKVSEFYWKAPKTGKVTFSSKHDDGLRFYFGNSFDSLEDLGFFSHNSGNWLSFNKTFDVEEGKFYAIKMINVNTGGGGYAIIGYKYEGGNTNNIPLSEVYNPDYPLGEYHEDFNPKKNVFENYIFEPSFIVSKKDGIKVSTTGTDKSEWKVVAAPEDIEGGRFITQKLTDPDTGEYVDDLITDTWHYLIDGQANTNLHTRWTGGGLKTISEENPHTFIIDTGSSQQFNYFEVTTRNNVNSYIEQYKLYLSDDNSDYRLISEGAPEYTKNVFRVTFPEKTGRYWKLVVTKARGGTFSVLAEIDAGIASRTQRLVPATSSLLYTTKYWKNTSNISSEQSGFMLAEKKNQKMVFRFTGENLALYAAVGENYGSAKIKLDGEYYTTLDFNSKIQEPRKLMLNVENLENETHTLEIITNSAGRVMINMLGINYTSELVNAPNIYLERGLTIALIVFVCLFVALLVFTLCLLFIPKFRKFMGGNRCIAWLDRKLAENKEKRKTKKAEKKKAKEEAATIKKYKSAEVGSKQIDDTKKPEKSKTKPAAKAETKTKPAVKAEVKPIAKEAKPKSNAKAQPAAKAQPKPSEKQTKPKAENKTINNSAEKSSAKQSAKTKEKTPAKTASKPASKAPAKTANTAVKNNKK